MQVFDIAKHPEVSPHKHVEKILGKVANGDFSAAYWEPGQISPYHSHPQATEIYFCFYGGGKMRTPQRIVDVTPGSFVVHPPAELHEYENGPERTLLFRVRYGADMLSRHYDWRGRLNWKQQPGDAEYFRKNPPARPTKPGSPCMQVFDIEKEQAFTRDQHVKKEKILGTIADGDFSVVYWEPGQTSPYHCHPDATEIYFCHDGGGRMRTPRAIVELASGMFIVHPPGEVHEFENGAKRTQMFRVRYGDDMLARYLDWRGRSDWKQQPSDAEYFRKHPVVPAAS
jgi:quercetin dioxygenase-like cupin family protein